MSWELLSQPKSVGGMGFRNLHDFNIALLGNHPWRLLTKPESLVARVFKSKYYSDSNFLEAKLGGSPSFVWRSVCEAQKIIKSFSIHRVGS